MENREWGEAVPQGAPRTWHACLELRVRGEAVQRAAFLIRRLRWMGRIGWGSAEFGHKYNVSGSGSTRCPWRLFRECAYICLFLRPISWGAEITQSPNAITTKYVESTLFLALKFSPIPHPVNKAAALMALIIEV